MTDDDVKALLAGLRLEGMLHAFENITQMHPKNSLTQAELVGKLCLAQREYVQDRLLKRMLRAAKFKIDAHAEDINWGAERNLDKQVIRSLLLPDWTKRMENVLITGGTGSGKTWLSCAIGNSLVRHGVSVKYIRTGLLLESMRSSHLDGTSVNLRRSLTKPDLLILDDFGVAPISEPSKEDLFELLEARTDNGSLLITGQLAPSEWHAYLENGHLADAIIDRIAQRSHLIDIKGGSLRQRL